MWIVKHIETLQTYKLVTDHEPPVELRTNDVNANARAVVEQAALTPEIIAILVKVWRGMSYHHPLKDEVTALIGRIERAGGFGDAPPR